MNHALSLTLAMAASLLTIGSFAADDNKANRLTDKLDAAKAELTAQKHHLRYKFSSGEQVRWKAVHLVTFETKIQGNTQTAKSRSTSTKAWKVSKVDPQGNITLVHMVESVDMWQHVSGRPEIRFNSETDKQSPQAYEHVAKSIGVPLVTVTMDAYGKILQRHEEKTQFSPWAGELTIPLPAHPVKVGDQWSVPEELTIRLQDGLVKRVKTRQLYTLTKVETGVATIIVETQVLTPVDDPKLKSQLVQRLTRGTVKFDIDKGRLISKQLDLDETVIGFNGAESIMQYLARFTEELLPSDGVAAQSAESKSGLTEPPANSSTLDFYRASRDDGPVLRR
jgi:hypothetical protein